MTGEFAWIICKSRIALIISRVLTRGGFGWLRCEPLICIAEVKESHPQDQWFTMVDSTVVCPGWWPTILKTCFLSAHWSAFMAHLAVSIGDGLQFLGIATLSYNFIHNFNKLRHNLSKISWLRHKSRVSHVTVAATAQAPADAAEGLGPGHSGSGSMASWHLFGLIGM